MFVHLNPRAHPSCNNERLCDGSLSRHHDAGRARLSASSEQFVMTAGSFPSRACKMLLRQFSALQCPLPQQSWPCCLLSLYLCSKGQNRELFIYTVPCDVITAYKGLHPGLGQRAAQLCLLSVRGFGGSARLSELWFLILECCGFSSQGCGDA